MKPRPSGATRTHSSASGCRLEAGLAASQHVASNRVVPVRGAFRFTTLTSGGVIFSELPPLSIRPAIGGRRMDRLGRDLSTARGPFAYPGRGAPQLGPGGVER